MSKGYAFRFDNTQRIDIRTVSETQRAAKVNAITLHSDLDVLKTHSDEDIDRMFYTTVSGFGEIRAVIVVLNDLPEKVKDA